VHNPDQTDADGNGIGDACAMVPVDGQFAIAATEVTNNQFIEFLNALDRRFEIAYIAKASQLFVHQSGL
jgi:formylglycine-generating enzyme required for sulfatase activity